ncbi:hypothetical protein J0S82_015497 [Galemys pyrenaicus]|uniref:Uncharacterized protein n=1 Tax=Galemys pyrenaicus TaxID=202257 RepID=A0A8J6DMC9_GALPY|nr:hypothetical protein J0S82_015497 [Galemys pyrenaicus]
MSSGTLLRSASVGLPSSRLAPVFVHPKWADVSLVIQLPHAEAPTSLFYSVLVMVFVWQRCSGVAGGGAAAAEASKGQGFESSDSGAQFEAIENCIPIIDTLGHKDFIKNITTSISKANFSMLIMVGFLARFEANISKKLEPGEEGGKYHLYDIAEATRHVFLFHQEASMAALQDEHKIGANGMVLVGLVKTGIV